MKRSRYYRYAQGGVTRDNTRVSPRGLTPEQQAQIEQARIDKQQTYLSPDYSQLTPEQKEYYRGYTKTDDFRNALGQEMMNLGLNPNSSPSEYAKQIILNEIGGRTIGRVLGKARRKIKNKVQQSLLPEESAGVSNLRNQSLGVKNPLLTKDILEKQYTDVTRPYAQIEAAERGAASGNSIKDVYNAEDLISSRRNALRKELTGFLSEDKAGFAKHYNRPDIMQMSDNDIKNLINSEVDKYGRDMYYKDTAQKLRGIDAYKQLPMNKKGGQVRRKRHGYLDANFHANDPSLPTGPYNSGYPGYGGPVMYGWGGDILGAIGTIGGNMLLPGLGGIAGGYLGNTIGDAIDGPNKIQRPGMATPPYFPQQGLLEYGGTYEQGGEIANINVEGHSSKEGPAYKMQKGELLVNGGKVLKNYQSLPPHPTDGTNPLGDVQEQAGLIIVPKKRTQEYLNSDRRGRRMIERSLVSQQERRAQGVMKHGGYLYPEYNYNTNKVPCDSCEPEENENYPHMEELENEYKKGGWIKRAINPRHKGWCTPLSNPHCTGHRRALALRFKHGDLSKHEQGGEINYGLQSGSNLPIATGTPNGYSSKSINPDYTLGYGGVYYNYGGYIPGYYTNGGSVNIPKEDMINEHQRLLHVLKHGTKKERLAEHKAQTEEMKEMDLMKSGGVLSNYHPVNPGIFDHMYNTKNTQMSYDNPGRHRGRNPNAGPMIGSTYRDGGYIQSPVFSDQKYIPGMQVTPDTRLDQYTRFKRAYPQRGVPNDANIARAHDISTSMGWKYGGLVDMSPGYQERYNTKMAAGGLAGNEYGKPHGPRYERMTYKMQYGGVPYADANPEVNMNSINPWMGSPYNAANINSGTYDTANQSYPVANNTTITPQTPYSGTNYATNSYNTGISPYGPYREGYQFQGTSTPKTGEVSSNGLKRGLNQVLPYAQSAYLGARWLFDKPEVQHAERVKNINPELIPENTGQQEIQDAYNAGYQGLKNTDYSALGQTALMTQRAKQDYQRKLALRTANAGIKNQTAQFNSGVNQYNSRMNWEEQNVNTANRAAKRNAGDLFFKSLGNIGAEGRQNEFYKELLKATYPNFKFNWE